MITIGTFFLLFEVLISLNVGNFRVHPELLIFSFLLFLALRSLSCERRICGPKKSDFDLGPFGEYKKGPLECFFDHSEGNTYFKNLQHIQFWCCREYVLRKISKIVGLKMPVIKKNTFDHVKLALFQRKAAITKTICEQS